MGKTQMLHAVQQLFVAQRSDDSLHTFVEAIRFEFGRRGCIGWKLLAGHMASAGHDTKTRVTPHTKRASPS